METLALLWERISGRPAPAYKAPLRQLTGDTIISVRREVVDAYKVGEISRKTGLQKQPDGTWKKPGEKTKSAAKTTERKNIFNSVSYMPIEPAKGSPEKRAKTYKKIVEKQKDYTEREEIRNCKTSQEVENIMKKQNWFMNKDGVNYNDYINIKEFDPEIAKMTFGVFDRIFKAYPKLKGCFIGITNAKIKPDKFGRPVYAQCNSSNGGITANTFFFKDKELFNSHRRSNIEDGVAPEGTHEISVITHELGHAIMGFLAAKHKADYNLFCDKIMNKTLERAGMKEKDIKTHLSDYAKGESSEFCAEAFSEYFDSKTPREIARGFGEIIEEELHD